jgi:hypothetical protein
MFFATTSMLYACSCQLSFIASNIDAHTVFSVQSRGDVMVTSETRLPDAPRHSGLLHSAIVVAGFELGSVVANERPSYLFSSVLCVPRDRRYAL